MIRAARPGQKAAILAVVTSAFTDPTRDASYECDVVEGTWAACPPGTRLELVAESEGEVVGHVLAAPGRLDGAPTAVAGVAPVCVAPSHQGRGLGAALVKTVIAEAEHKAWPLLVLLGDPAFYGRFGFEPAGPLGFTYAPAGTGNPHFQARRLPGYDDRFSGSFTYCWE
jgi:putative acetyltransferase